MRFLRSNTAVIITVGPFYDKTDGVTIETALTITNERITLTADTDAGSAPTNILDNITGATSATANDLNYITGNDAGLMQLELAAADVNRVGRMFLSITDAANHVPVFHEFTVLPQAIYDWLIAGSIVPLPANMTQVLGSAVATPTVAGVLEVDVTHWIGTAAATPSVAGVPEVDLTHVAGATTNVSALATNVAAVLADTGTDGVVVNAASLAADAVAEIADAVWDEDATGHQTTGTFGQAIGDPVADTNTIYKAVVTDAAGATVGVDVVAVKADTAAILVDTGTTLDARIPAALVSGRMDASVGAMAANVLTATAINADAITAAKVAADVSAEIADQVWDEVLSGHLTATTTGAALNGATAPTAAVVADAVWDEVLADHLTAGTTGNALNAAGAAGDPWSTAIPGAYGAGTAGKILGDNVNATISSRASQTSVDTVDDFLDTEVAAIKAKTDNLPSDPADQSLIIVATDAIMTRLGAPAGASVSADIAAIEAQTDDIGVAGAGLTAVPWNAAWDAEVQSEVDDALVAQNLDHLVKVAVDTNFATTVHLDSVIGQLADAGGTATFDRTTDALEVLHDQIVVVDDFVDTEVAAVLAAVDTEVAAIKAKTDQLAFTTANQVDANVLGMAANVVTAATIAAGAIDAATFAANALDASALAADAVAEIQAGLSTLTAAGVRTAVGLASANLDTQLGAIATNADAAATVAEVATEISDALRVDTVAAPTGVPGDTVAVAEQIGRLYQVLINGLVVDATTGKLQFKNAAGTIIWEKDLTDAASIYTESKGNAP